MVGCDVDEAVCARVNAGEPPFPGEEGLSERLAEVVAAGRLRAQADTTAAVTERPDLVVAVPPLVVDAAGHPDYGVLDSVVEDIGHGLRAGTTVSLETTVPVGTTRERVAPRLAELSGLAPDDDLLLVFSPERVYSGRVFRDLRPIRSWSAGSARAARRGGSSSTASSSTPRSGRWAGPRRPSSPSSPRPSTAT